MNQACEALCDINIVIHARVDDGLDQAALARAMHRRGPRPQSALRDESSEMKILDFIHFLQSKLHRVYLKFGDTTQIPTPKIPFCVQMRVSVLKPAFDAVNRSSGEFQRPETCSDASLE